MITIWNGAARWSVAIVTCRHCGSLCDIGVVRHSPRKREVHEAEHGACEQGDGVRLVEEVEGDVLHLLLVDHAEMHPVVHIIFTQSPGAERGSHALSSLSWLHLWFTVMLAALSPSGVCCTNATRMSAMHVCNPAPNARTTQPAARGERCMQGAERWHTLWGKTDNSCIFIGLHAVLGVQPVWQAERIKTCSGARGSLALKVTLLCWVSLH